MQEGPAWGGSVADEGAGGIPHARRQLSAAPSARSVLDIQGPGHLAFEAATCWAGAWLDPEHVLSRAVACSKSWPCWQSALVGLLTCLYAWRVQSHPNILQAPDAVWRLAADEGSFDIKPCPSVRNGLASRQNSETDLSSRAWPGADIALSGVHMLVSWPARGCCTGGCCASSSTGRTQRAA